MRSEFKYLLQASYYGRIDFFILCRVCWQSRRSISESVVQAMNFYFKTKIMHIRCCAKLKLDRKCVYGLIKLHARVSLTLKCCLDDEFIFDLRLIFIH